MVKIISDNKQAEKILSDIVEIVSKHGAYIDEDIEVHCQNGYISVKSPNNKETRPMFRMPHTVLIPFYEFDIQIKKNQFVLKSYNKDLPKVQVTLMKNMLKLYNVLGQLEYHRKACPWIAFKDHPAMLEYLMKSREREYNDEVETLINADGSPEIIEDIEKKTFFRTRLLKCRLHKKFRKPVSVLLPLIDSLNHNIMGPRFFNAYPADGALLAVPYKPIEGYDECFVTYRRLDAMDSYLDYAFIDENAPIIRSIPLRISLQDLGTISIRALDGYINPEKLPEDLKDIVFYMPVVHTFEERNEVQLSHLYIPQTSAIFSMRRILKYSIELLKPGLPPEKLREYMGIAEQAILKTNQDYFLKMKKMAETIIISKDSEDIFRLSDTQINKIQTYISSINSAQ